MPSTSALLTGLSGLNVNARRLEVIGNNIANVNVTGYKANRLMLSNSFSRNFSLGSVPTSNSGGTNPSQVGLGVTIAGTQRDMTNGAIANTGVPTDLAIEGGGFFILNRNGETTYTRAGSFQLNASNQLLTQTGERVQGFGIDKDFNIIPGQLSDVEVPLGSKTIAQATSKVELAGNLRADGAVATAGSAITFNALDAGGPITGTSLLTAITPATTFTAGDTITISGGSRGGKIVPDATFTVGAASTVDDFMSFVMDALGVVKDGGYNTVTDPGPEPGGYTIDPAGVITLTGNWGTANDLTLGTGDFVVKDSTGVVKNSPFVTTKTADATGEAVRTTFITYDSLGTAINVDATMVLSRTDSTGTYWRAFFHSADDTDLALHLESGDRAGTFSTGVPLIKFDGAGKLVSTSKVSLELDRKGSGATDPLKFDVYFDSGANKVTGLADSGGASRIAGKYQDGSPIGTLTTFSVGEDGTISGGFSNGLSRTLGRVGLANFDNPQGLVDVGNNQFKTGANSGNAVVANPGEFGTGRIVGGALEQSNVDLSQQFIEMIQSSTGYSAASRVITTGDQLLQQLIALGR